MNIKAKKFKIEMSHNELWSTAFDVRKALEYSLKTHWVNHQDSWITNEKESLNRCRIMFNALSRPELFEEVFKIADIIFSEFNKQKNK